MNIFLGRHLRLAAPEPDDIGVIQSWTTDSRFLRKLQFHAARPLSLSETTDSFLAAPSGTSHIQFRLRTRAENRLVGYVTLYDIYPNLQTAMMGIAIGRADDRGKGFGRDGVELLLRYAFDELNLYRVGLTVLERNSPAHALYRSVGFIQEGVLRAADFRDGIRSNEIQMSMLLPEYRERIDTSTYFSPQDEG